MNPCRRILPIRSLCTYTKITSQFYSTTIQTCTVNSKTADDDDVRGLSENLTEHMYHKLVPWKTGRELADYLYANALYEDNHMIALNKPNKLARYNFLTQFQLAMDNSDIPHGGVCLNDAMPHLMKFMKLDFLDVTLGMFRDSSGVIVLSKNKHYHDTLRGYFKYQVRKEKYFYQTFWAVTHGVPNPQHHEERIGIAKEKVGDFTMSIIGHVSRRQARAQHGQRPYMRHSTLAKSEAWDCSLVRVETTSTRWDSIQVYLASHLAAILGDHVYGSRVATMMGKRVLVSQSKCPPKVQDLPRMLLKQLQLGRKDAFRVPQHLHHRELFIPKLVRNERKEKLIVAPLPEHFCHTLHWLGITIPPDSDARAS